ncbi:hypothetical protein K1719_014747 [Acacia pycnantha]|nr:hypothetical protein K1719_014747 [Acacia pycnantha]
MSGSEVDQFTNSEFPKWLRSYFVENPSDPNKVAWSLSYGAAISVTRCKKYIINGYRFSTVEANAESRSSGKPVLLLTAAVAGSDQISQVEFYPFQDIAKSFDWINVMVYDLFIPDGSPDKTQPPALLRNPTGLFSGDEGILKWI